MKLYISSTFMDLREHRASVDRALRRMGHDVLGMEQYVAEGTAPLEKCLRDVRASDAYVLILGWRYGFIPRHPELNAECLSITELEYREAVCQRKSILVFLLDPDAPWPPSAFDALGADGGQNILRFRSTVGAAHLSGIFRTPDDLASQVAAGVSNLGLNRQMVERGLEQAAAGPSMVPFLSGAELHDTTVMGIREMVSNAGTARSLVLNLGAGNRWWSTRLYLLVTLLQTLTPVRQIVFSDDDEAFVAMASPAALRQGLCDAFPPLAAFDGPLHADSTADVERETDRVVAEWHKAAPALDEPRLKVGVRPHLLSAWVGERLVTRCIDVPPETGLTMVHVQQIVESLVSDVPVDWPASSEPAAASPFEHPRLMVVDRDAFALAVARQLVRAGVPRAPIR
ncbi:DUF4062 domain-containing protein [Cryptosporangium minutisporangium]